MSLADWLGLRPSHPKVAARSQCGWKRRSQCSQTSGALPEVFLSAHPTTKTAKTKIFDKNGLKSEIAKMYSTFPICPRCSPNMNHRVCIFSRPEFYFYFLYLAAQVVRLRQLVPWYSVYTEIQAQIVRLGQLMLEFLSS